MQELYELINKQVAREARRAQARWNNLLPADDIEQEIWLFLMENPSAQRYLLEGNQAEIAKALMTRADIICSRERLSYDHFTGNFHYSTEEVRDLLEDLTQDRVDLDASMVDLDLAMADLEEENPNYYFVLHEAYAAGIEPEDTKSKTRAVDKLTTIMNRKRSQRELDRHEGPGTKPKIVMEDY